MNRARAFFYVCAGLFLLALSWHLGASSAGAQIPSNPVVAVSSSNYAFTANGDVYYSPDAVTVPYTFVRNVFGGGPIQVRSESWGQLKNRYREPAAGPR